MKSIYADFGSYPASNVGLTIRIRTLRTSASRVRPTDTQTPASVRSQETIMRYLCAADATRYSTRLAKRLFGKVATLLSGRGSSTKRAETLMRSPRSSRRHFGFSGEW